MNQSIYYFNPCKTFDYPIGVDPYTVEGEQCHNVLGCKRIGEDKLSYEYYAIAIRLNSNVLSKETPLTLQYYGSK